MSEFKFACPICSQHLTADANSTGKQIECPTCFHKLVVPQAPSKDSQKFILTASEAERHRETPVASVLTGAARPARKSLHVGTALVVLVVLAVVALGAWMGIKTDWFKVARHGVAPVSDPSSAGTNSVLPPVPWTLDLTDVSIPKAAAAGKIHWRDFVHGRATVRGGVLNLRMGNVGSPELGVTVVLYARSGEDLSGKTVEISTNRPPPLPRVVLQWKDGGLSVSQSFTNGYALRAEFGQVAGGRLPGKIYLCLPDESQSRIAGTFEAEIRRPATPAPRRGSPPPRTP